MLNGDRGKVDYTVHAGDLMTDTHNAPQHMIGIRRRGRMRMQSVALLSPGKSSESFAVVSYDRA